VGSLRRVILWALEAVETREQQVISRLLMSDVLALPTYFKPFTYVATALASSAERPFTGFL
jgi:hypothetical protein